LVDLTKTSKIIAQAKEMAKHNEADTPIGRLITVHNLTAASILHEISTGPKKTHWAWWVFPTESLGVSDHLNTSISMDTYNQFLRNIDLNTWREILQEIAHEPGKIPSDDHGRIYHFCQFWKNPRLKHIPRWLPGIIATLEIYFAD
jgi:hypothetical protein